MVFSAFLSSEEVEKAWSSFLCVDKYVEGYLIIAAQSKIQQDFMGKSYLDAVVRLVAAHTLSK